MKKTKNGFTLTEIIIAVSILSIAVFGIIKMISENKKLINNSENIVNMHSILPNIKECLNNLGFDNFYNNSQTGYSINFGSDGNKCLTGDTNSTFTENNNIEFISNTYIKEKNSTQINWIIEIKGDGVGYLSGDYIQSKK